MPSSVRSANTVRRIDRAISAFAALKPVTAWSIALGAFGLLSVADYASGPAYSFNALYMVDVSIAAWSIGSGPALLLGLCTIAFTTAVNGFGGPFAHVAGRLSSVAIIWNLAMRALNLSMTLILVGGFRRAFLAMRSEANRDPLTNLLNRRGLEPCFEAAINRGRRGSTSLLIAAIDLDRFKLVNDSLGHDAGDTILRSFALSMKCLIRAGDCAARLGGDEFVLVIDVADYAEAKLAAARLHDDLKAHLAELSPLVSCSMGAVICRPLGRVSAVNLLRKADELMYSAKSSGLGMLCVEPSSAERLGVQPLMTL